MGRGRISFTLKAILELTSSLLFASCLLVSCGPASTNTLVYGKPRTFQIDAVVGHHDGPQHPSHFSVQILNGRVEVVEFPGGDAAHAQIYMGPQLTGSHVDQAPVALRFLDLTGNGRLDMIIQAQGSQVVLLNNGEKFVPVPPDQEKRIMQRLHQLDGD